MSQQDTAEVCVDPTTHQAAVQRLRDGRWWLSRDGATARELGAAVLAALEPGESSPFGGDVCLSEVSFLLGSGCGLVVDRRDQAMHLSAPPGALDAPPEITLGERPTPDELGEAVLAFVQQLAERQALRRRSVE